MSLKFFNKGKEENIPAIPNSEEKFQAFVSIDEHNLYFDMGDGTRIKISDFIEISDETKLPTENIKNKIYFSKGSQILYIYYNNEWIKLNVKDYTQLNNLPSLNGIKISGDKILSDYGIPEKESIEILSLQLNSILQGKEVVPLAEQSISAMVSASAGNAALFSGKTLEYVMDYDNLNNTPNNIVEATHEIKALNGENYHNLILEDQLSLDSLPNIFQIYFLSTANFSDNSAKTDSLLINGNGPYSILMQDGSEPQDLWSINRLVFGIVYKNGDNISINFKAAGGLKLSALSNPATAEHIFSGKQAYSTDGKIILGSALSETTDVTEADILEGIKAYKNDGTLIVGNMDNYGGNMTISATGSLSGANYRLRIPNNGYYNTNSYLIVAKSSALNTILPAAPSGYQPATAAQVAAGYYAYNKSGTLLKGTATISNVSSSNSGSTILSGYYAYDRQGNLIKGTGVSTVTTTLSVPYYDLSSFNYDYTVNGTVVSAVLTLHSSLASWLGVSTLKVSNSSPIDNKGYFSISMGSNYISYSATASGVFDGRTFYNTLAITYIPS